MGRHRRPVADHGAFFDDGVGTDADAGAKLGPGADDGTGVNEGAHAFCQNNGSYAGALPLPPGTGRSMIDAIISASATRFPSTKAFPAITQILLFRVVIFISNMS